uniref:MADF domain-containing protein n=1 Tax=Setaria digitata TaxID=48799 RepID=A0A915PUU4_9BILA
MEFKDYNHALIDTVRNSPYLYDPSNKHYKKGRSRVELWEEVSKKLQAMGYKTTGEKCRERWNCLKGRFVRERNTLKKLRSSSLPYVPRKQPLEYNPIEFQAPMKYETSSNNNVEESIDKQIHRLLAQNGAPANHEGMDSNEFVDGSQEPPTSAALATNSVTVHALQKIPLVGTDCAQIYPLNESSFTNDPFVIDLTRTKCWNDTDQASSSTMSWQWYHDELLKLVRFFEIPSYRSGSTYDKSAKIIPSCSFLTMLIESNLYLYTNLPIWFDDIVPRMLLALYTGLLDEGSGEPYFSHFIWPLELERSSFDWDEVVEAIISRYPSSVPQSVDGIINTVMMLLKFDDNQEDIRNLIEHLIPNDLKESLLLNLRLLLSGFQLLTLKASTFYSKLNQILEESLDGAVNPFANWQCDQFRLSCIQMNLQQFKATIAFTTYHCANLEGRNSTVLYKSFFRHFIFHNISCYRLIYDAQEISSTPMHEFSRFFFVGVMKKQLEILYTALNLYQDNGFRISESRFHGFTFPEDATALYFPICQLLSPLFCFCLTPKMIPELYAALLGYINKALAIDEYKIEGLMESEQKRWMEEGYEVSGCLREAKKSLR